MLAFETDKETESGWGQEGVGGRREGWDLGWKDGCEGGSSGAQGHVRVFSAWEPQTPEDPGPPSPKILPSHTMCPCGH